MSTEPRPPRGSASFDFAEVMKQFLAGSDEAAQILEERHYKSLVQVLRYRYLKRGSPLRTLYDTLDFVQMTFLAAWDDIGPDKVFPTEGHFKRYLFTILVNQIRTEYRKHIETKKRSLTLQVPFDLVQHDKGAAGPVPSERAQAMEKWVRKAQESSPLALAILEAMRDGEPLSKVAEETGVSLCHIERIVRHWRRRGVGVR